MYEYPGWFHPLVFALAVVLYTFGLTGDPLAWMQQTLSFLMPRQRV